MSAIRTTKHTTTGFTIVELLLVIVVIAILAAITIVAYNGITVRASNISRLTELRQWEKLFKMYNALNGTYPAPSAGLPGNYCLGTGYPTQSEINSSQYVVSPATSNNPDGYCRDFYLSGTRHEADAGINNQLRSVGTLPGTENHKKLLSWANTVGPFYPYGGTPSITAIFAGRTCPEGTTAGYIYNDGNPAVEARMCTIQLP